MHLRAGTTAAALLAASLFITPSRAAGPEPSATRVNPETSAPARSAGAPPDAEWPSNARGAIDPAVFRLALGAASCAVRTGVAPDARTLTVIDYSRPSTERRLWVYDLTSRQLLYEELVAHGAGSGGNIATRFSNQPDSHQTSLGLFVTADTYVGSNGYSLRMKGLDPGFNDKAMDRAIVMHGAPYVNANLIKVQGRIGRSWGCPALREAVAREVIDRVKGGGLVFSYYPDREWLTQSRFLSGCQA